MEGEDKTVVNESERAAAEVSQVNPNPKIANLKDKGLLVITGLVVTGIVASMFFSGHSKAYEREARHDNKIETRDVLSKNLAIIKQLKADLKNKQAAVSRSFNDGSQAVGRSPVKPQSTETSSQKVVIRRVSQSPRLTKEVRARMNAPTTFVNTGAKVPGNPDEQQRKGQRNITMAGTDKNSQFINQQSNITTVTARKIAHPDFTVPAGEFIPATMEVAMNSELPGMISAVVERNIYSLTGQKVLIPRGSKLQGQYNAGVVQGQSRFLVVWNRVRLPNGVIATLNSPGTDGLGRSGLQADSIDRHFMERFGTATLLSILGATSANLGVDSQTQYNSASQYRSAIADSLNQTARQVLEKSMQINPTLSKYQGVEVNVFVAHDLDFYGVGSQETSTPKRVYPEVWK